MLMWTGVAVGEVLGDWGGVGQRVVGVCAPGTAVGDEPAEGVAVPAGGLAAGVAGWLGVGGGVGVADCPGTTFPHAEMKSRRQAMNSPPRSFFQMTNRELLISCSFVE